MRETPPAPGPALATTLTANRQASALALVAIVTLSAMVAITAATGVSQEQFEVVGPDYATAIAAAADALRAIVGLDAVFLIAYAGFFALLPRALGVADHPLARLGVRLLIAVAVLDIVEDQHLLAMARSVELGRGLDPIILELQHVLSQTKFHLSYLGLAMLALALPRARATDRAFAWLLGVPLPLLGALQWAAPSLEAALNVGRWLGFLGGFGAALVILAQARRAPAPADAAAATGAPA